MTLTLTSPWALLAILALILAVAGAGLFTGWSMGRRSLTPVQPAAPIFKRKPRIEDRAHPTHSDPWTDAQDRGEPHDPEDPDEREDTL